MKKQRDKMRETPDFETTTTTKTQYHLHHHHHHHILKLSSLLLMVVQLLSLFDEISSSTQQKTRYRTIYACEDRQLIMDCDVGSKINVIRSNYGRFSITQCNEQGQLDLSTDCMSPITFRIMQERCENKTRCSVNATSSLFGDKCPKTRKYLEVHFQCVPDNSRISLDQLQQPERVDLRNSSLISNQQQTQHPVYPHTPTSGLSTSPILPPNNPSIQQATTTSRQQQTSTQVSSQDESVVQPQFTNNRPPFQNNLQQQQQQQQPTQPMTVMNSEILSYNSIYNPNNISSEQLINRATTEPIVVTLRHTHTENMSNPRCVLWDQAANLWTERGSQIIQSNSTHTICAFDQATSYLLVMDYLAPYPSISQVNPLLVNNNNQQQQLPQQQLQQPQIATQPNVPQIGSPYPGLLELQPAVLDPQQQSSSSSANKNQHQPQQPGVTSSIVKFFSLFGYMLVIAFVFVALMTIAFIASSMRSSAGAAIKSLGNFTAFSGPKYKNNRGRADGGAGGQLHNKDFLVINNQNGHQFLYAPANPTKINSSSTHILTGQQNNLHQQLQQQQQMYSGNGTLSNLSGTGGQSNNYYYGLMGLTNLFQQQQHQQQSQIHQQQQQHHLSQHHLNQLNQPQAATNYHQQANKSTISTESSNSTPSSSGVESGSTSVQQQQQQQQGSCLMMNNDFNLMNHLSNYGQHQNLLSSQQQQPTLTLNAHYSSSGAALSNQQQHQHHLASSQQLQRININQNSPLREHIYESVDDDKPYTARLLFPTTNLNHPSAMEQFSSNTLSHQQQQQLNASRAMTLSTRFLQNNPMHQHQQQTVNQLHEQQQNNKRLLGHPSIVRDNQPKTNIICSKLVQVTPQRATEINKFQHDMMAIYNSNDTTTTTTTSNSVSGSTNNHTPSSSGNSSTCYGGADSVNGVLGKKLSTDC